MSDNRFPPSDGTWSTGGYPNGPSDSYPQSTPPAPFGQGAPYQPTQPSYEQPGYEQPSQPQYGQPAAPYQPAPYQQPQAGFAQPGFPQATPWQPAPPPRRRRTGLIIGLVILVIVVLCGVGVVVLGATSKSSTTGGKSPKKIAPTVVSIAPGDGQGLLAHLAPPPAGAKTYPIKESTNGVENLDQYMSRHFSSSPDERSILQDRGFEVVAENDWVNKAGVEVETELVQFKDSDGANGQLLGQHGAIAGDKKYTSVYKLAGLSGYGAEDPTLDKYGDRTAELICQDGPIFIVMFFTTPGQFDRAAELAQMKTQLAALAP